MNGDIRRQDKMSEEKRVITIPTFPSWVKTLALIILILGSSVLFTDYRINQEKQNESYIRYFYVESRVKVSFNGADPKFIDLIRIDSILEADDFSGTERLEFEFLNSNIGVDANFSGIELFFYIEVQLYDKFESIVGSFFIEDKTGIIRKHEFSTSSEGMEIYVGIIDIQNLMWKDDVPQEIRTSVLFTNG